MKGTAAILRSHIGVGLLRILVPALLLLAAAGTFLFVTSPAAAGPPIDDLILPVEVEENRDPPKRVTRDVQGQGASITQQATPTPGTLVSNIGRPDPPSPDIPYVPMSVDRAQSFTTGTDATTLTRVDMEMRITQGQQVSFVVEVWTGDSVPTTKFGSLGGRTSLTPNTFTNEEFAASGDGIALAPNTKYWVVIDVSTGSSAAHVRTTHVDGEDPGATAGWSIGDEHRFWSSPSSSWQPHSKPYSLKIRVVGYVTPPPAPASAEVNGTSLVITFDKDLDTTSRTAARQFGIKFGGGALQNATAISIDGRQVTLTVPEVRAGQLVTVSYTVPTSNPLKGTNGVDVDAIVDQTVKVNTGPAYGRLPEGSEKVRDAVYVTESNGEVIENRAASADRETLYDYFYDSCSLRRSLSNAEVAHDYSHYTEIVLPSGATKRVMTQARNGWRWVWTQDPTTGAVTGTRPQTLDECASRAMYHRQAFCRNLTDGQLPEGSKESTCPTDRTW